MAKPLRVLSTAQHGVMRPDRQPVQMFLDTLFKSNKYTSVVIIAGILLTNPGQVFATWSIVAADPITGEVGGAVATCTPWASYVIGIVPGKGIIVTQAASNKDARKRGEFLIGRGESATKVVHSITNPEFDHSHAEQQHGVVVLSTEDSSAGYTGASTAPFTGDIQDDNVSVQGNILVGPEVLSATLNAFLVSGRVLSYSLADRLLIALEAGASEGGDRRCGKQTAISAYLVVSRPKDMPGAPALRIVAPVQYKGGENAVKILRQEYEAIFKMKRICNEAYRVHGKKGL